MDLYLKKEGFLNGEYFYEGRGNFAICPYTPGAGITGLCWEYGIILKIKNNAEGYFDFSKSLIDIGSEDGGYAMFLDFDKNYCFEPNRQMCCLIWTNMYLKDKVDNTFVYNVFLGENNTDMVKFDGFSTQNSVNFIDRGRSEIKEIVTHTLDEYNINNVGLIKTDTEGFDYFVLKGGVGTIVRNNYPPILFENWPVGTKSEKKEWTVEDHDKINSFLTNLGYTIFENWGDDETHLAVRQN